MRVTVGPLGRELGQVQAENGLYVIQSIDNVLEMDIVLKLCCLALGNNE